MRLDEGVFTAFSEGFLPMVRDTLTSEELSTLARSPFTLTAELAARFLTDYLHGDVYFNVRYPEHNLRRTRAQIALAKDMLLHETEMDGIIRRICAEAR